MPPRLPAGLTFEELLANLSLGEDHTPRAPSPRTPPPCSARLSSSTTSALYYYESPTKRGFTTNWRVLITLHLPESNKASKKKRTKKAVYVVFVGRQPGVHRLWADAEAAVSGVSSAIHRGYVSILEAEAVYAYASTRHWTRSCEPHRPPAFNNAISTLPAPSQGMDDPNPLHGSEVLDNTWFVVYRGIAPGVHHSVLEALLNTVGLSKSLYESVEGQDTALSQFRRAVHRGETAVTPPAAYSVSTSSV
ncbi:hypothetical protein DFH09DRAFT_1314140 [Mycena vulgaris]|nr:hypothetical protein DFH09DRAFT_1314140 [Mycena vulgaris]